jgi:hypothetical protein
MNINICLSATHNSDASCIPHGCRPNAWGTPNIFQFCDQCSDITLLEKNNRPDKNNNSSRSAEINISPNPFADRLTIKWKGESPKELFMYNSSGMIVYRKKLPVFSNASIQPDLPAGLPAGTYLVKLVYEKMVLVRQVVKTD